jgi:alpha-1,2-mannosyltransferase
VLVHSLTVNGLHAAFAIFGFLLIHRLAGSPRYSGLLWPFTALWGAATASFIFMNTQPTLEFVFWDFTECYWLAGKLVLEGPQALAGAYSDADLVFVNLPIVAYLFAPFGLLPDMPAAIAITLIGIGMVGLIWRLLVDMFGLDARESALLLLAICAFGPLLYSFKVGNTSHFILALILGGLAMVRSGKGFAAGALFGLAALIKPALVLVGILYFLRGRWSVVAGGAAVLAGSVALSLLIFGWDMHVLWYETSIAPYAGNTVPAYANQTLAGLLARFELGGPYGHDYSTYILSPASRAVVMGMSLALVAAVAFAAFQSRRLFRAKAGDVEVEVMLAVAFAMTISPLSWAHYHVWVLPALVMLWVKSRPGEALDRLRWPLIGTYALLAGTAFVSHSMTLGRFGGLSNFIVSHWLFGTVALIGLLAVLRAQKDVALQT